MKKMTPARQKPKGNPESLKAQMLELLGAEALNRREFFRFLGMKSKLGEIFLSLQMNFHPRPVPTVTSRKYSIKTKEILPSS